MLIKGFSSLGSFILVGIFSTYALASSSVIGTVKFEGQAPHHRAINMEADAICLAAHKDAVYPQTFLIGEGNTLGNVFVYVKSGDQLEIPGKRGLTKMDYPAPTEPAILNQKGCDYAPHVLGVMVGQKVKFLNTDGTLHNVHGMCKVNPEFNAAMPNVIKEMEKVFNKPEFMFPVRCDVHPWMVAWMAVMSHPFFTVTTIDGQFEIKNLPAGTYEIEAWHEKLGTKTATIIVKDGANQTIDFTFSSPQ